MLFAVAFSSDFSSSALLHLCANRLFSFYSFCYDFLIKKWTDARGLAVQNTAKQRKKREKIDNVINKTIMLDKFFKITSYAGETSSQFNTNSGTDQGESSCNNEKNMKWCLRETKLCQIF